MIFNYEEAYDIKQETNNILDDSQHISAELSQTEDINELDFMESIYRMKNAIQRIELIHIQTRKRLISEQQNADTAKEVLSISVEDDYIVNRISSEPYFQYKTILRSE